MRFNVFLYCTLMVAGLFEPIVFGETLGPKSISQEIGNNASYAVVIAGDNDTYESLAQRYLGDPRAAWRLRELNDSSQINSGQVVVTPKSWNNPLGVHNDHYQTITVLTYHRFGPRKERLSVTPENFRRQLNYLRENNYNVVTLKELSAFMQGKLALPPKAVVITIDDGYRSTFDIAYPLLLEFGFSATVFVYSDFINLGGLNSKQLSELKASGLIDIQPHSKTHSNMAKRLFDEEHADYRIRMAKEIEEPAEKIEKLFPNSSYVFAFPYGAVTTEILDMLTEKNYSMAATVERGANGFFAHPYLVKRTMIYHEHTLDDFAKNLVIREHY